MQWWYEPYDNDHKWESFEDVVFAIASTCINEIEFHETSNYYIYNDNGLFTIIKSSELDAYSKNSHKWNENELAFIKKLNIQECRGDFEEKWDFINNIIYGVYERNAEELKKIKTYEKRIYEYGGQRKMNRQHSLLKEYQMKYNAINEIILNVNHIHEYNPIDYNFEVINETARLINDIYDLKNATEEYGMIVAFDMNLNILGILPLSHGNDLSCTIDPKIVFRFLLLIGATQFILIHNHASNVAEMSDADIDITKRIMKAADFMNINLIEHIIICKKRNVFCLAEMNEVIIDDEDMVIFS